MVKQVKEDKAQDLYSDIAKKSLYFDKNNQVIWLIIAIIGAILLYGGYFLLLIFFSIFN